MAKVGKSLAFFFVFLILAIAVGGLFGGRLLRDVVKRKMIATVRDRFAADLEMQALTIVLFPHLYVSMNNVVFRRDQDQGGPPLMAMQRIEASANYWDLLRSPRHLSNVHIDGLELHLPPRSTDTVPKPPEQRKHLSNLLVVDEVTVSYAMLEMIPRDPNKIPHKFEIHQVVMNSFSFDHPAPFHASLTNAIPRGEIETEGQFGPWQPDDPGNSVVNGTFTFTNADMSTLKGIAGTLSSQGSYDGVLDNLQVEGDTEVPNFMLRRSGNAEPLKTHYIALVDGTSGDTVLKSVAAVLGSSMIEVNGEVVGIPGIHGRAIELDATAPQGKLEDFIKLALKGQEGIMEGMINLHTKIDLRPGEGDLLDRLTLQGEFATDQAHFTRPAIRDKVDSLSRRGQGQPKNWDIENVVSNLRGKFVLRNGKLNFSQLAFVVPGATVRITGSFNLTTEEINFHGHLLLDAKLSKVTTGVKSVLMKVLDPVFKGEHSGADVPIKISGTRASPHFGLDL